MGDNKLLDTNQVVNGLAVLLSFFVGYKFAVRKYDIKEDSKSSDESEATRLGEEPLYTSLSHNFKMVLVVRNDLKMGKGKLAAQCGHGAVGAYQKARKRLPSVVKAWENTGSAKIVVKVESEAEMMAIKKAADAINLITCLVMDAGRTQIAANSKTVLAIGPSSADYIDRVTGQLKLL